MSNYTIEKIEPVPAVEVVDVITKKGKEKELTYREEKIKDYLKKIIKIKKKDFPALKKEILALEIPRLEEEHIIKIIDLMPKDGTELRTIVSHSGTVIVDESVDKILSVLQNYR